MSSNSPKYQRHSLRLSGYDYTSAGLYFVTICTHERELLFDTPQFRAVAERQWQTLAHKNTRSAAFKRVTVDTWIVMPDHVHAIIMINDSDHIADHVPAPEDVNTGGLASMFSLDRLGQLCDPTKLLLHAA